MAHKEVSFNGNKVKCLIISASDGFKSLRKGEQQGRRTSQTVNPKVNLVSSPARINMFLMKRSIRKDMKVEMHLAKTYR